MTTSMVFTVRAECLRAVAPFQSDEQSHYYLNGVLVQSGLLIATDGYRLAAIKPINAPETNVIFPELIMPSMTIKRILAIKSQNKRLPIMVSFALHGEIRADFSKTNFIATVYQQDPKSEEKLILSTIPFNPIDGIFPEWKRIIPSADSFNFKGEENDTTATSFNPKLLGEMASLTLNKTSPVALFLNKDPESAAIFRSNNDIFEAFALLMPEGNNNLPLFPEWLSMELQGVTTEGQQS